MTMTKFVYVNVFIKSCVGNGEEKAERCRVIYYREESVDLTRRKTSVEIYKMGKGGLCFYFSEK